MGTVRVVLCITPPLAGVLASNETIVEGACRGGDRNHATLHWGATGVTGLVRRRRHDENGSRLPASLFWEL